MLKGNILAHRGFWESTIAQNSMDAFENALHSGFGIETDIRDANGKLIISHDVPASGEHLLLSEFCDLVSNFPKLQRIALNIKSDGLQDELMKILNFYSLHDRCFVFDMSLPEKLRYADRGFRIYDRISEYEKLSDIYKCCDGIWVDNFTGAYSQVTNTQSVISKQLRATFVSPELHARDYKDTWLKIKELKVHHSPLFEICTDHPQMAFQYFQGE